MEELGRKMVYRFAGLPLAIIVLGGLLATKHTAEEWIKVHEKIMVFSRKDGETFLGVSLVFSISYGELSYQLKSCFLHLAHFPENFDIPIKKLVRLWVAEGIVSQIQYKLEGEETIEDVAECFLVELLNRGMVQVGVRGSSGRVKTCRFHNLMRDLCLSRAHDENFLKKSHIQEANESMFSLLSGTTIRIHRQVNRVAVYLSEETYRNFSVELGEAAFLRSLLFFGSTNHYGTRISQKMISKLNDFKLLRVLDLERCYIAGELAGEIGNLTQLRYLCLNCSLVTTIPSSIGNLRHLQTLILQTYWSVEISVPNELWKMEHLRHLYLPTCIKKSSAKLLLGNLRDLQTLQGFDTRSWDLKELIKVTKLKKLGISHLKSFKEVEDLVRSRSDILSCLCSLNISVNSTVKETDLQNLSLHCGDHLCKLSLRGRIDKLPECDPFFPNLTKLTLRGSQLEEEDSVVTLEKLPNLCVLHLRAGSFTGDKMVCSSGGFLQLKSLVLSYLPHLKEWRVDEEAMPSLCELVIENCMKLKTVPDGLRFITTLQELEIQNMPLAFRRTLQKGGDDYDKVKHVPSIIFK